MAIKQNDDEIVALSYSQTTWLNDVENLSSVIKIMSVAKTLDTCLTQSADKSR